MRIPITARLIGSIALLAACAPASTMTAPSGGANAEANVATVLSLSPANATVGVDPTKPVVITFSHSMMTGMELLVVLHEGSLTGPTVVGVATWSTDRTILTFAPSSPLKSHTTYMLHLSPSLKDSAGKTIDLAACTQLGGKYATAGMMGLSSGTGMMNSGTWGPRMMGAGWQAAEGTFGMVFSFTTA